MNLCDKCKYPCFIECSAMYSDVEYAGIGPLEGTIIQCDIFENANLNEPRGVWPMDKPIEDFKQIAYNMRREGQISRADAVMYLIERVKIAEGRTIDTWLEEDIMLKISGKTYRCDCGCNVFRYNKEKTKLKCNACPAVYDVVRK